MDLAFDDMWSVLGLHRGGGLFLNFKNAPIIYNAKCVFLVVDASLLGLIMLLACTESRFPCLLFIGQQVSALTSHWLEDCANFTPTPEENEQYSANHY